MGGAPEAASGAEAPVPARLNSSRARPGAAAAKRSRTGGTARKAADAERTCLRVEELPEAARAEIDRLLAEGERGYQEIAAALQKQGLYIVKEAVGRRDAARNAEARQRTLSAQLNEMNRWMKKHPGFDMAGAALTMVVGRLCGRLESDEALFDGLSAEKAASGLIAAARAIAQHEKAAGSRKKEKEAARAEVISQIRRALTGEPGLRAEIERLIGRI